MYPLDTNEAGYLHSLSGLYKLGEDKVDQKVKDLVVQEEKDAKRMQVDFDKDFRAMKNTLEPPAQHQCL